MLENIVTPEHLRSLTLEELKTLSEDLRAFILQSVSTTGGHLSSNLGTVELSIALHHVFNTPDDKLIWDVGHQSYGHKILTGRKDQMATLRQFQGLSGFPKRSESSYDAFGTAHSSTSISAALGMACAAKALGLKDRQHIAVIGDGALTGGMAFEAMNNAGAMDGVNLLVILNDNDMSISPPVGALNRHLAKLLSGRFVNETRHKIKQVLQVAPPVLEFARRFEEHTKGLFVPASLFEALGLTYFGPIDGHDLESLVPTLENIRKLGGVHFLHVVTRKGQGYKMAEEDPVGYHGPSAFDPNQGICNKAAKKITYTEIFSQWICDKAASDAKLMAITPAMREGSGLVEFERQFPERYFDVGIAEQHAATFAAGLACDQLKPVLAIYSTFLQRAYDQVIHDIALQNLDVTFAIDRAGLVGADGATHAGAYDIAFLRCIPNLVIATPSNEFEMRALLNTAYAHEGPAAVRYPRGAGEGLDAGDSTEVVFSLGVANVLRRGACLKTDLLATQSILSSANESANEPVIEPAKKSAIAATSKPATKLAILGFGPLLAIAKKIADQLDATLVDMRWVKPLDEAVLLDLIQDHTHVVTIEDSCLKGGAGSAVGEFLHGQSQWSGQLLSLGLPDQFIDHGDVSVLYTQLKMDEKGVLGKILAFMA